jgi:hypothetical protein
MRTNIPLFATIAETAPVFAFALYYNETDAVEREKIHNQLLYTSRIIDEGNNRWKIINTYWGDLIIETGGKSLFDNDALWTYYYVNKVGDISPTISGSSNGEFILHRTEITDYYITGDLSIKPTIIESVVSPGIYSYSIGLTVSGSGCAYSEEDIDVGFEITTPLELSTLKENFTKGSMMLTTTNNGVTDMAKATYALSGDAVNIEYNGYKKQWSLRSYY